jgi:hypothetical protein
MIVTVFFYTVDSIYPPMYLSIHPCIHIPIYLKSSSLQSVLRQTCISNIFQINHSKRICLTSINIHDDDDDDDNDDD